MAKTPPPLPSDVARHAGAVAVAAGPAQPQAAPFKHRKAILTALDVEVPREDPPAGYGFGRRAPAYGPSSPTFPRTSPQQTRRRLGMPQVDPSVPSVTTTPEQLEHMQQQRRRGTYGGESPNEPRVRYGGPQPGGPRSPGGGAPPAPGGRR